MKILGLFDTKRDSCLDQAISQVREDQPDAESLAASARRVWQRIQAGEGDLATAESRHVIQGCGDIRALLPAFYKHELRPARAAIVEDHLRECISCRAVVHGRGFEADAAANWQLETTANVARRSSSWPFFVAAAAAALVGLVWAGTSWYFAGPPGIRARIASADGQVFAVSAKNTRMLKSGDKVDSEEFIRTAAGSHATVKLLDGSDVEMNQRSAFAVSATRRDTTIQLDQGGIIVHAAKRRRGHLYVSAPDCRVAVTGTIFSVNSGVYFLTSSRTLSKSCVCSAMNFSSVQPRSIMTCKMPLARALSRPGRTGRKRSAVRAIGVMRGSMTMIFAPLSRARQM